MTSSGPATMRISSHPPAWASTEAAFVVMAGTNLAAEDPSAFRHHGASSSWAGGAGTVPAVSEAPSREHCYVHTDRDAGVRCQRCGRHICPWCMHQASVGFHCPECTKTGAQKVVRASQLRGRPLVTMALVAANAIVFLISLGAGDQINRRQIDGLVLDYGIFGPFVDDGEWYRLVTGGFLHSGVIHLGFNVLLLWMIGTQLEAALGRWRYGLLYAVSLLAGSAGAVLVDPLAFTVGASGAVYGLMGATVVAQRAHGISFWQSGIGTLVILNIIISLTVPGISVGGHAGGLVGGLAVGWLYYEAPKRAARPWVSYVGAVALLVLVFGLGLWAASTWQDPIF